MACINDILCIAIFTVLQTRAVCVGFLDVTVEWSEALSRGFPRSIKVIHGIPNELDCFKDSIVKCEDTTFNIWKTQSQHNVSTIHLSLIILIKCCLLELLLLNAFNT